MCFGRACDFRDALTDDGFGDDYLGFAIVVGFGLCECLRDGSKIVAIDGDGIPLLGMEIGFCIFALGDICHGIEGDVIGVVDHHQVVETAMAREGDSFFGNTFLEAAVAEKSEDVMIENCVICSVVESSGAFARESKTDGIGDALTERAGGGFYAGSFMELRVAWGDRMQLTEVFHLL